MADELGRPDRRRFMIAAGVMGAAGLAGCSTTGSEGTTASSGPRAGGFATGPATYKEMYGTVRDAGFRIPAVPIERINKRFYRQMVRNPTGEPPGRIVVDTNRYYLYYTMPRGRAVRYGVGLGRAGFEWAGRAQVGRKSTWPRWFPPDEMIDREPQLEEYRARYDESTGRWEGGMQPGLLNPLGARALYIYQDGRDTLYRLHGSPEWNSIGKSVSSGCVRLMNQDIIDLYKRADDGTPILVSGGLRSLFS